MLTSASTPNGLPNGHAYTTAHIEEPVLRDRIQRMYNNARAATRVVYERGVGQDGENWIVRILICNALARVEAAT